MSNNRPVLTPAEQAATTPNSPATLAAKADDKEHVSTPRMLAREAGRIVVVGSGVATALYPLDLAMQYVHTNNNQAKQPPKNPLGSAGFPRSPRPSFVLPLAAAKSLLKGYASSTQASMIKNATLAQRGKLLNPEKVPGEEKLDLRAEEFEEGNSGNLSFTRVAAVSGAIGIVDTTLTQYAANQRTWHFHQFYLQQETAKLRKSLLAPQQHLSDSERLKMQEKIAANEAFRAPKPKTLGDYGQVYRAGYPLRLSRNIMLVGGLLTASVIEEQLKPHQLTPGQSTLLAATLAGAAAGFGSNFIDVVYKNQLIAMKPNFQTPTARATLKRLVAESGAKVLTRGYGPSILYTVTAYNVVPYMEALSQRLIPKAEKAVDRFSGFIMGFFNQGKAPRPGLPAIAPPNPAPSVETAHNTPKQPKQ